MSAFEVNLTPNRAKMHVKPDREPTDVVLAPFSSKAIVTFENVPVEKTARRVLNVINTSSDEIKVLLTKSLNPIFNMSLEWTSSVIPGNGCKSLEMIWNPTKEIQCRETIQFTDNRNFRKDVAVIMKSIKKVKPGTKRFPTISSGSVSKSTLKLKPQMPSNNIINNNRKSMPLSATNAKAVMIQKQIHELQIVQSRPKQNLQNIQNVTTTKVQNDVYQDTSTFELSLRMNSKTPINKNKKYLRNKENVSPATPENASLLFDKIKFTPATEPKSVRIENKDKSDKSPFDVDYLASLPTPVGKCERGSISATPLAIKFSPEEDYQKKENILKSIHRNNMLQSNNDNKIYKKNPKIIIEDEYRKQICQNTFIEENSFEEIIPGRTFIQDTQEKVTGATDDRKSLGGILTINNKTFDLKNKTSSFENLSILQNTTGTENYIELNDSTDSSNNIEQKNEIFSAKRTNRLSAIAEMEESYRSESNRRSNLGNNNNTNNKSPNNLKRDVKLVGTPLRKVSESLKDLSGKSHKNSMGAMGSMPDLNSLESLQSIEQNRYYYQKNCKENENEVGNVSIISKFTKAADLLDFSNLSCVSNADVCFNQYEIRAASSRFNLNEARSYRKNEMLSPSSIKLQPISPSNYKFYETPDINNKSTHKRNRFEIDSPTSSNNYLAPSDQPRLSIAMTVSPPKKTRFAPEIASSDADSNSLFRVVKWKSNQPMKKLRLQKNSLSLIKKQPTTPKKIREDLPRQKLYNAEHFIQHYINPDPFAATTILDPFLAATMYLDEESTHKYEIQFKKWLNALVTIPSELDSNCEEKIDVGKLFNEVRNKELILAPTKEEQSMNYLTKSRMDALRSAAVKLYMNQEMHVICSKVAVYVKKGAIKIRSDRDLHLDVVLQRTILELLLCYNTLWLRLGLEVVFGEVIHLHSNSDIISLSTFIVNRLFRDKFIEKKYSRAYALSDEYRTHMKVFTLEKILFLILFLDKAKNNRIITHNPCLFVKKSQYKESKEILLRISSELLSSVGDITRELRRLGYVLFHKQTYIDEFDYAFKNLAIDLRDGVRLTKIMEIILLRDDLTKQLRCPAISRLQRIHNVNLGLKALSDADFQLKGEITAHDIVDGHREKTLSLLWQIIYKFRSPKFIAAATTIQRWWRFNWLKVVISRRIKEKEEIKRNKAATVIQSYWRGLKTRKFISVYKKERTNATVIFQKNFKMFYERRQYIKLRQATIYIQKWYRNQKLTLSIRSTFVELKYATTTIQLWYRRIKLAKKLELAAPIIKEIKNEAKLRYECAIKIQRTIKSFVIRKKFKFIVTKVVEKVRTENLEYKSASKIQAFYKMSIKRKEFILKKDACIKIQRYWRSYKLGRLERARFIGKQQATIAIQTFYRSYLIKKRERTYFLSLKKSTIFIQRLFRANCLCKKEKENFKNLRNATIVIQKRYRALMSGRKARQEYVKLRQTVLFVQSKFRANKLCKIQRFHYQKLRHSAIVIQSNFKALIQSRKFKSLKSSTLIIQRKLRATLEARRQRHEFLELRKYTEVIQKRFRANKLMKNASFEYKNIKNSAIIIQRRYRALIEMRKQRDQYLNLKDAVIYIQTKFRANLIMKKTRNEYLELKKATQTIQTRYRALKLMQKEKYSYQLLLKSVTKVQIRFRANLLMKKERNIYLTFKSATLTIQSRYRAIIKMRQEQKSYNLLKQTTIYIQQKFRANKQMIIDRNNYKKLQNSVIRVQRQFRANVMMKEERDNFLQLKSAVLLIKSKWRANKQMCIKKEQYLLLKKNTILMQRKFRANKLMKVENEKYKNLKEKVIFIQRKFRANAIAKVKRQEYMKIRSSALLIQSKWRAYSAMKKQRQNYLLLKKSAIVIQQRYRAKRSMKVDSASYKNLKEKVIFIQRKFRANRLTKLNREEYIKIHNATTLIQSKWRAYSAMKKERNNYLLLKKSVIIIQQRYRANQLMQTERNYYENLYISVLCIQQRFRANYLMKKQRTEYLKIKESTIKIQRWVKSIYETRRERNKYLTLKKACLTIQTRFRSNKLMKMERLQYNNYRNSVIFIQQQFRSIYMMKKAKKEYQTLKEVTIKIQRKWRSKRQLLEQRNYYMALRTSVITIQQSYRAYILMKEARYNFITLRTSVIYIQQKYRANIKMKEERQKYLMIKSCICKFQVYCQGFLARKRFQEALTPEIKEFMRQTKAAKIIQKYWRGYRVRRSWRNCNLKMIREKIKLLKGTANACNTVRYKITHAVKFLNGKRCNVQEELNVLLRLEKLSRTVPHFLMDHSTFISTFCYSIMAQACRSEIDKQIIELCSRIILNLARYNSTTANTFQENGLVTIAQMLLRWCDKESEIFNTLCTLIWIFSHCSDKNRIIRKFMTTPEAIYMLRETRKLVLRKEKMRKNVRRNSIMPQTPVKTTKGGPNFTPKTLPSLEPDFGIIQGKPYIFISSIFAFDTILNSLGIKEI